MRCSLKQRDLSESFRAVRDFNEPLKSRGEGLNPRSSSWTAIVKEVSLLENSQLFFPKSIGVMLHFPEVKCWIFFCFFFCVEKERSLMKPVGEMSDVVFRLWQNSFLVQRQAGALTSLDAPELNASSDVREVILLHQAWATHYNRTKEQVNMLINDIFMRLTVCGRSQFTVPFST